jgi:hypothetical protein
MNKQLNHLTAQLCVWIETADRERRRADKLQEELVKGCRVLNGKEVNHA